MDATNRNTALASAMVDELARCGLRYAVLSPGSRSTPLALALWREPRIEISVIVDERSAGFVALGAAAATAAPVAVLCTSGTAAANLHPAVCEADESAVPLVVLTADRPPELRGIGAGQTIDQLKLYGSAVRWFCELGTHEADDDGLLHFRSVGCRAFWAAAGDPRPGPVHLNVPWRDPLGPEPRANDVPAGSTLALEGRDGGRPLTTVPGELRTPSVAVGEALARRIESEPRGLIVAGRMPPSVPAAAIAALAAAAGYPILAEPTSQLRLGRHDRSLVVSAYDPIARARPAELTPELVLRFGEMPTCKPLRQWLSSLEDTTQLVVDPDAGWNEPTRIAGALVRADPGLLCEALADRLGDRRRDRSWADAWLAAATAADAAVDERLGGLDDLTEPGLHRALGRAYRDGELVYTASSLPIRDQEAYLAGGDTDVAFLANRGANGIDGLVSSGIGAAWATGRPTVIVTGELGMLHDVGGLAAVSEAGTAVRIVVIDNGGGMIFEHLPQAAQLERDEFESLLATPRRLDLAQLAGAFGVAHRRLERPDDLPALLAAGTGLIEVAVDGRESVALRRDLMDAARKAVESSLG